MSPAYQAGHRAFREGQRRDANPHDGGLAYRQWADGWDAASREAGSGDGWP